MIYNIMMCLFLAKDKGEKKLFGFAFTPLMREDGTTLSDESHELYVYKVCAGSTHIHILYFILYVFVVVSQQRALVHGFL